MNKLAIAFAILAIPAVANAQERPSTTRMSCQSASALIVSRGAIVLSTGGDTYDRFVRDQSFCDRGLYTKPTFVPAADNPQCMVGYRCVTDSPNEDK